MAIIKPLKTAAGENLYPVTSAAAVYDAQGVPLAQKIEGWDKKAQKALCVTVTLAASGWTDGVQTVAALGVTADNAVFPGPAPDSWEEAGQAGVRCTAQAPDSLTFTCSSLPAADLTYQALIWEVM